MKLSEFLVREAIITDLLATTKEEAIREIVRSVQDTGHVAGVDTETLTGAFLEREALGSTAIGKGVACPHGGHEAVDRVFGTIALSRPGVAFDALDGTPVHIFYVLFHTHDQFAGQPRKPGDIFDAFEAFMRFFEDDRLLDRLRQCPTREEVFDLIVEGDREAPGAQPGCG